MSKKSELSKQKGELVKEISPEAIKIIERLPEDQRSVILRSMTVEEYHGPIPPPALLKQYNEIIPDAAERILRMAEGEQAHRHKSVNWMVRSSFRIDFWCSNSCCNPIRILHLGNVRP